MAAIGHEELFNQTEYTPPIVLLHLETKLKYIVDIIY